MVAHSPDDIDELVIRAQAGDKEAIATLYEQFVDQVYRFVASRIPDEADAEDVTANVFIRLLDSSSNYQVGKDDFQRWLYSIAKDCIREQEAKRIHSQEVDTVFLSMMDQVDAVENEMVRQEQLAALRVAMRSLSPDEYSILILRFVEGKRHEEVAEILGKSISATRIMQFRALKSLARALDLEKKRHYLRPSNTPNDD